MADEPIVSIRSIMSNADYLSNWATSIVVAGGFSLLISAKDKLVMGALLVSFCSSTMLDAVAWLIFVQYGYGGLGPSIALALVCGCAGLLILMTLIGIIRRFYRQRDNIADSFLKKGGVNHLGGAKEDC